MTYGNAPREIIDFNAWLGRQPRPHKIVIAGNHDRLFESHPIPARTLLTNAVYLEVYGLIFPAERLRCVQLRARLLRCFAAGVRAVTSSPMGNCGATLSLHLITFLLSVDCVFVSPGVNADGCATNLVAFFCKHADTRAFVDTSWLLGASKRFRSTHSMQSISNGHF
jgi:hypothetical protein